FQSKGDDVMNRVSDDLFGHFWTIYYVTAPPRHNLPAMSVSILLSELPMPSVRSVLLLAALIVIAPLAFAQTESKKSVSMKDMKFDPAELKIKVGETVTWTNKDDRDHTVVFEKAAFKSENIKPNGTYSHKFTQAGKFDYACSYHPRMKGLVTVTAE